LGDALTLSAEEFFTADKPEALDDILFDTAGVDIRQTGTYPVTAVYEKDHYTIQVQIQDTTAPEIALKKELPDVNLYDSITAADFVDITDQSACTAYFVDEQENRIESMNADLTNYSMRMIAVDAFGNESKSVTYQIDYLSKISLESLEKDKDKWITLVDASSFGWTADGTEEDYEMLIDFLYSAVPDLEDGEAIYENLLLESFVQPSLHAWAEAIREKERQAAEAARKAQQEQQAQQNSLPQNAEGEFDPSKIQADGWTIIEGNGLDDLKSNWDPDDPKYAGIILF